MALKSASCVIRLERVWVAWQVLHLLNLRLLLENTWPLSVMGCCLPKIQTFPINFRLWSDTVSEQQIDVNRQFCSALNHCSNWSKYKHTHLLRKSPHGEPKELESQISTSYKLSGWVSAQWIESIMIPVIIIYVHNQVYNSNYKKKSFFAKLSFERTQFLPRRIAY